MTLQHPEVAAFIGKVTTVLRRDDAESFWACEPCFAGLLQTDCIAELLNEELRRAIAQPDYLGSWKPRQLVIFQDAEFKLTVSLFGTQARYIHTAPSFGMYSPLGNEGLQYEAYRFSGQYRNDVFDPSIELAVAEKGIVGPRDILRINPLLRAYDFRIEQPVAVVKFTAASAQSLEWLFNRNTLCAWQANDAELNSTQLRVYAYVLGRLAHQSSLTLLERLAAHPHHAVRWAAVQNIGRLNRKVAVGYLEKAQSDPHPHVRRAAEKTLLQINQKKS